MSDDLATGQYRDSSKLMARMRIHLKYGNRNALDEFPARLGIPAGASVLEVGCGPGRFWERAASAFPADLDILLTDISPGMVEEALARVRGVGLWGNVRGQVADVMSLPFADASFDVVMAMHMLYHAPDPAAAVAEIARVLRPGGMVVVTTNGLANFSAVMELSHAVFGGSSTDPGAAAFSLEAGEDILRQCFGEVEVIRSVDVLRVTDPADVVAFLLSYPPGDAAGPDARDRLEAKVKEAFAAGDGVFPITRDSGCLIGRGPLSA
ncbi:MAG TPA: methyltransferase domain-containing protein [Caulobacteraceae bacterium]|jgi:SAM-dependent methyltransferase|nr:methyltransferase domain-containing protein [Caulobacteraceae bacterium]